MGNFMKKIVIMSLLATILIANNLDVNSTQKSDVNATQKVKTERFPNVYSALGNIIYSNVANIVKLKELNSFKSFSEKIDDYSKNVEKLKSIGFKIESGDKSIDKSTYLKSLRALSKENDYFVRSVKNAYATSIQKQDSDLFVQAVNSGLIDTEKNREQIVEYYLSHSQDINASGIIQKYLDEDAMLKLKKKSYSYEKAKKLRDEAKVRRIREEDKKKQAQLEKELTEEVKQKKLEIIENQKRELFH